MSYEQCWERFIAQIRQALPLAEELGVVIAIENVWNDFITKALDEAGYEGGWGIAEQGGGNSPEGLKDLSERMDKIFAS